MATALTTKIGEKSNKDTHTYIQYNDMPAQSERKWNSKGRKIVAAKLNHINKTNRLNIGKHSC